MAGPGFEIYPVLTQICSGQVEDMIRISSSITSTVLGLHSISGISNISVPVCPVNVTRSHFFGFYLK